MPAPRLPSTRQRLWPWTAVVALLALPLPSALLTGQGRLAEVGDPNVRPLTHPHTVSGHFEVLCCSPRGVSVIY